MDNLPAEILLCIAECSTTLPELLKYRRISRRFKQVVDDNCKPHAFYLLHQRPCPVAVDDALLAIRLKRIPWESCCHYDHVRGDYSFYPSKDFFEAVQNETEVPPGCPSIPAATWFQEVEAVMDLYLLVLAYMSTGKHCHLNFQQTYPGGYDLDQIDSPDEWPKPQTEAIIRSHFRLFVFTTVYAPRVFVEPLANISAIINNTSTPKWSTTHQHWISLSMQGTAKYPVFEMFGLPLEERTTDPLFDGFFEWLYAQSEPREFLVLPDGFQDPAGDHPNDRLVRTFPGEERHQVALMQLWKVHKIMDDRNCDNKPARGYHIASQFNPIQPGLTDQATVYRQPLQISIWSEPQLIINNWTEGDDFSLVLEVPKGTRNDHINRFVQLEMGCSGEYNSFDRIFGTELKNRFGLEYIPQKASFLDIDYGVLDPRPELKEWV